MRIALFLKDNIIDGTEDDVIPIIILHTNNKSVMEVEKDILVKKDINYLALWLLTKRINELYVAEIDQRVKNLFEKIGVTVRKHEEVIKNPLLKEFLE